LESATLYELNHFIRRALKLNLPDPLWVSCEIAQINLARGHYYLDLVQKHENDGDIVAQAQAALWQGKYRSLRARHGATLDELLREGLQLRMLVGVEYHERYGLKLIIEDLDPAYTLGQLALQRRRTVERLRRENLLDKNRELSLPPVLQRVAVLTSERAAGYQDFLRQLHDNAYGYRFHTQLYEAAMQGRQAVEEICEQLRCIDRDRDGFDCAIIIRGGGARLDLSAFDHYDLCRALAHCALPVITGIGHETDQTVVDLAAHTALKTPTAAANFLVERNLRFESALHELGFIAHRFCQRHLREDWLRLRQWEKSLNLWSRSLLGARRRDLGTLTLDLPRQARRLAQARRQWLDDTRLLIGLLSPEATLRRGFTQTFKDGESIDSARALSPGDRLLTRFADGSAYSVVESTPDN
jgi:exodeoxyribonuclease VII large subunit